MAHADSQRTSMEAGREPVLRVVPYRKGITAQGRVYLRLRDRPRYLCLTTAEAAVVDDMAARSPSISDYLSGHLAGDAGLTFSEAVTLVVKLNQADFLTGETPLLRQRIDEWTAQMAPPARRGLKAVTEAWSRGLDMPLFTFDTSRPHRMVRSIGAALIHVATLVALVAVLAAGLAGGHLDLAVVREGASLFRSPVRAVVELFFAFSLTASWLSFWNLVALAGTGVDFVGGSIRLSGLCVLRLAVGDDDAVMASRAALVRYRLWMGLSPFVWAVLAWRLAPAGTLGEVSHSLAGAFFLQGVFAFCPLFRSPLVKLFEGGFAMPGWLDTMSAYLQRGLFGGGKGTALARQAPLERWIMTLAASWALVWLYAVGLGFFDATVEVAADLAFYVTRPDQPLRAVASGVLLALLAAGTLLPWLRLVGVPAGNLMGAALPPLRKARRSLAQLRATRVSPTEAVVGFLGEIPTLSHLSEEARRRLASQLRERRFIKGETVIREGEEGGEFYVVSDGEAQIVVEGQDGGERVIDVLRPGDSFGEIALIERCRRTATVRALEPLTTLVLTREDFDSVFPEGQSERDGLTRKLRLTKLVMESQALSHLAPRQIGEIVERASTLRLARGTPLIEEGRGGDAAYLIDQGEVEVRKHGERFATLGRGDLVGAISLVKNRPRTATVVAASEVTCLRIDKETFLRMCLANVFVALLVEELSDKQLAEQQGRPPRPSEEKAG